MKWPESPTLLARLLPWFEAHRRAMPWRHPDLSALHPDPYAVLVSELMLQQTQVATVVPYFIRWRREFPDLFTLAAASDEAVHKAWEGLGYYRRARHLHASAKHIAQHGWPTDFEGLMKLPGLGPYSAAAVASIAFQWPEPALDGNAFRVLARLLGHEGDPKLQAKALRSWLRPALEKHGPSRITQGLMELGATVCAPTPNCAGCPLSSVCEALRGNATHRIPLVLSRAKPREFEIWLLGIEADGHWLLREPAEKGLLAGLWTWPQLEAGTVMGKDLVAESALPFTAIELRAWAGWTQVYTHRRELVSPLHLKLRSQFKAPKSCRWIAGIDLEALAFGKRDRRLVELLKTPGSAPLQGPDPLQIIARIKDDAGHAR